MTFIMSLLSQNGISMASDSNVTTRNLEVKESKPYLKTKYFERECLGVSVWGELTIAKIDFWNWFEEEIDKFFSANESRPEFARHLAKVLDSVLTEENKRLPKTGKKQLGIHLAFFCEKNGAYRPSIFHVTNKKENGEITRFMAQPDRYPLSREALSFYLINGAYEPFSDVREDYKRFIGKIRKKFKKLGNENTKATVTDLKREDLLKNECESLIATIRLYQAIMELEGIKKFIGGNINAVCFTEKELVKNYRVPIFN